jgi:hypothetical protein
MVWTIHDVLRRLLKAEHPNFAIALGPSRQIHTMIIVQYHDAR